MVKMEMFELCARTKQKPKQGKTVPRSKEVTGAQGLVNFDAFELTTHATLKRSQTRRGPTLT